LLSTSLKRIAKEEFSRRVLSNGEVTDRAGGKFRIDATAWAILALSALQESPVSIDRCRARLRSEQGNDGRVWISRENPDSFWPTALAVLAWQDAPALADALKRAVKFLLETTGVHRRSQPGEVGGHDPALKGWPWVANTHSWIEPTVLSVIALKEVGYGRHDRVQEALKMILNRQLPHGGWNSGNTLIFGRELHPNPEGTGAALIGLARTVDQGKVVRSIEYLRDEVDRLHTPVSLGWALLGLGAWNVWPSNGIALTERCLAHQSRYGDYDTSALCLLVLGALAGDSKTYGPLFSRPTPQ
jgi:hypothetical protein